MTKICIYGAGAIGGHIAGHMVRSGCEVSLVTRGPHLEAIQKKGLRIIAGKDDFTVAINATNDPSELGQQDYIFITLKSHQVPDNLLEITRLMGPKTVVLPPTTGIPWWYFHSLAGPYEGRQLPELDSDNRQWDAIGPDRVIGCAFWTAAEVIEPGVVRQDGLRASYPIGEPSGGETARLKLLADLMTEGGLHAPVQRDIRGQIWTKMINSLCWNTAAFLTEAVNGRFAEAADAVDVVRRMMVEMEKVAVALGANIPTPMEKRIAMTVGASNHIMSMLQDLTRGRPIELDALADSVRVMSGISRVPTPTVDTLIALTRLKGRIRGVYPH